MEMSPILYDPPFSSYAQISFKNGVQSLQKCYHLNFDNGFELEDLENIHDGCFLQIERIR